MIGPKTKLVALVAVPCLVADQITKLVAVNAIPENTGVKVIPGLFDLTMRYNRGAAFSLFDKHPTIFFLVVAGVAMAALIYFIAQLKLTQRRQIIALAAVLGGAVGNLIDRVRLGAVIDFLLVYFRGLSWPAFNVADAAIVIGVLVFLYDNFREGSAAEPGKSADAKDAA
ncbi:MAG: signal peptidase II [Deltaproteobacteria bacterium]|nr:signal peptidase II [Deltaproteobacteria bacterium]MCB9480152.1 signal peptidase II [Deltaproteobacteria bacterium]MCB9487883.1 signal peptidase II [Deltaproteobacteria bacterium]